MNRHEEYHVTVAPGTDRRRFQQYCEVLNGTIGRKIKALDIELNTFERQLMVAANFNAAEALLMGGFLILRVKHEVSVPHLDITTHGEPSTVYLAERPVPNAVYYECHVKLNGQFRGDLPCTSRDLFRHNRWYMTKRSPAPFNPGAFVDTVTRLTRDGSHVDSFEYEACLHDSRPQLDTQWMKQTQPWL